MVGPSSVGGYYAAQPSKAGHEVTLCVRTPLERLVIQTQGGEMLVVPSYVTTPTRLPVTTGIGISVSVYGTGLRVSNPRQIILRIGVPFLGIITVL